MSYIDVPKVDIHVHLEGTITPDMVRKLAARNNIPVPAELFDESGEKFYWKDDGTAQSALMNFVHAYDVATSVMKSAQDYTDITYDYLMRAAAENCIYVEFTISADHGKMVGLTYAEMMAAIEKGYQQANAETGIEMRCISTFVRHYGPEAAVEVAKITRDNPHWLTTGLGLAGNENSHNVIDFKPAYEIAGLANKTAHGAEARGPESARDAMEILNVTRIGHMVRAPEDAGLMQQLKAKGIQPEVCISSNDVLKVFNKRSQNPIRRFFDEGFNPGLGSDDPTFFGTTIGNEYKIAQEDFGFTDKELVQLSRNSINMAFVDEGTRKKLLAKLAP